MSDIIRQATKIMLIRHAEKPSADCHGVTFEGKRDKESLSIRGWQRAGALASLFAPTNNIFQHPALTSPQCLYASKFNKHKGSRRPFETISPLAEKVGIKINSGFLKSETEQMLKEALAFPGVVLICWQQEYLPKIANLILGDKKTAPQNWSEQRFDVIWVFDRSSKSDNYLFGQVPQNLLEGDLPVSIE